MLSRMIAALLGIIIVSMLPVLLPLSIVLILLGLGSVLVVLFRSTAAVVLLYCLLLGGGWATAYGHRLMASQLPASFEQQPVWVEGQVIDLPKTSLRRGLTHQTFVLQVDSPLCQQAHPELCTGAVNRLRLNWYGQDALVPGQYWRLLVSLKRPHGMANPGTFDYRSWLIKQHIGATGYVKNGAENKLLAESRFSIDRWRMTIAYTIEQVPALQHPELLTALLTGDKRRIQAGQWQLFANTGVTHLMVISGLHIGLVSGMSFFAFRLGLSLLRLPLVQEFAALGALGVAMLYAGLSGFGLPAQRAVIMLAMVMLALIYRRHLAWPAGLLSAALICLLFDPLAHSSPSFWLSFGAVAFLLYVGLGRVKTLRRVQSMLSAQMAVFLGLLPILAMTTGQLSLISPLANIVLLPLFSVIVVPINLLALLCYNVLPKLSVVLWRGIDGLIAYSMDYLSLLTRVGEPWVKTVPAYPLAIQLLALFAVLLLLLPRGVTGRWLGCFLLVPLFTYTPPRPATGDLRLTVLDVSQGLAVLIETHQHQLLYDVGAYHSEDFNMATAVIEPYFASRGISEIARVILSHNDNDHAGSWQPLAESLPISSLMYGEESRKYPAGSTKCSAGQQWLWDGVKFEILSPLQESVATNSNNKSCVLRVSSGEHSFLLPGDIDKFTEQQLLYTYGKDALASTVLIAPHHGSHSSSSWAFIRAVAPEYVVFSSGYKNQFNHPAKEVVKRYQIAGSKLLNTADKGAVTFSTEQGVMLAPVPFRSTLWGYWQESERQPLQK